MISEREFLETFLNWTITMYSPGNDNWAAQRQLYREIEGKWIVPTRIVKGPEEPPRTRIVTTLSWYSETYEAIIPEEERNRTSVNAARGYSGDSLCAYTAYKVYEAPNIRDRSAGSTTFLRLTTGDELTIHDYTRAYFGIPTFKFDFGPCKWPST